jgi:hypothetical protein
VEVVGGTVVEVVGGTVVEVVGGTVVLGDAVVEDGPLALVLGTRAAVSGERSGARPGPAERGRG